MRRPDRFRQSIRTIETLPCDILLTPHPDAFGMQDKLRRQRAGANEAFVDPDACRSYAGAARARLEQRIAREGKARSQP